MLNLDNLTYLGYENGWAAPPPEVRNCDLDRQRGNKHATFHYDSESYTRTQHIYGCRTCGYYYRVDSGD